MVRRNSSSSRRYRNRRQAAQASLKEFPFSRLLPNITTLLALCVGLTSIRFALNDRFEMAVIAILIAALLDAMDGRLARMLGVASHFGAELDSLADFVSFGVAPAVVLFICGLHSWGNFGWAACLFFVICSALRLARFNTELVTKPQEEEWQKNFFIGVPTPVGALLALLPMMVSFATEFPVYKHPIISAIVLMASGLLMVSKISTFSTKGMQVSQSKVMVLMLGMGILITALITDFWATLSILLVLYLIGLPFSHRRYLRKVKEFKDGEV